MKHIIIFNDNQEIKRRTSGAYRLANIMQDLGWKTTVVDWVSSWQTDQLLHYLDSIVTSNTVLFGISYTWMKPEWCTEFITKLKQNYPGKKYIVGGQQFIQHDLGADVYLYGYADLAIKDTINWLFDKGSLPVGMSYPHNLNQKPLLDCNQYYPAMNLGSYTIEYSDDDYITPEELLTVEISRGCRFKCKYCNYAFLGIKEDTSTSFQQLRSELINNWKKWGTHNYIIADDTLNDRKSKLQLLVDVVESLPFEVNFAAFIRIDLVAADTEQIELLERARVWAHFYGIETFNAQAGRAVGKGMSPDRIKSTLLKMKKYMMQNLGLYRATIGMIAGLPHETPESWKESEKWLLENWSDNAWHWWPLEISSEESVSTVSAFSRDWKKHGYRIIKDRNRINEIDQQFSRQKGGSQHKFDYETLYWEADWTDIGVAADFCNSWRNSYRHRNEQLVGNFHILWLYDFYDRQTLLELTEKHFLDVSVKNDTQYKMVIEPYINKKITNANLKG
jgi:hypothetical protein